MSEVELEQKLLAIAAKSARGGLAFVTTYVLMYCQSYLTTGFVWPSLAVSVLASTGLGIPVARFALCVIALMVLIPPPLGSAVMGWVRSLGAAG